MTMETASTKGFGEKRLGPVPSGVCFLEGLCRLGVALAGILAGLLASPGGDVLALALRRARGSRSLPHVQPQSLATPARFEAVWPRSQALSCPWDLWLPPAPCLRSCWLLSLIQTLQDHIWAAAVTRLSKKGACGCYLGGREIKGTGAAAPHRGNVFMSTNSNQRMGAVCFISARGSPFIWVRDVLRGSFRGHRVAWVPASPPRLHQHLDGSVRPPAARRAAPCRVPCRSQHQQQS